MRLSGELFVPGDKSITHRGIMLGSIAKGTSRLVHPLMSDDTLATLSIVKALGVSYKWDGDDLVIFGTNNRLLPPIDLLDCGNSGTTARLLLGLLSGRNFTSMVTGDASLKKRPMARVVKPLRLLGASISLAEEDYLPAKIHPSKLKESAVRLQVASAQVKSALMLAGLNQSGMITIHEYGRSRDHTERMIEYFNGAIKKQGQTIHISGQNPLIGKVVDIPGDISSAAFFIIAALILPDSRVTIRHVGLNPTRIGLFDVLRQTGADLMFHNERIRSGEPIGDVTVTYKKDLKPFVIDRELVPRVIDEIPILALLATQIDGRSIITGAEELRIKETDRLRAIVNELTKLGANIQEHPDGLTIEGKSRLKPTSVSTYHDHRMSMTLKVAELLTGPLIFDDPTIDRISYPHFSNDLQSLLV